jgi:hypothetical protein
VRSCNQTVEPIPTVGARRWRDLGLLPTRNYADPVQDAILADLDSQHWALARLTENTKVWRAAYAPGDGQTSPAYFSKTVQYMYISCYVIANKLVLSYLLLRLLLQKSGVYISVRKRYLFPPPLLKMIFFPPLATHHFSTSIVAFFP